MQLYTSVKIKNQMQSYRLDYFFPLKILILSKCMIGFKNKAAVKWSPRTALSPDGAVITDPTTGFCFPC